MEMTVLWGLLIPFLGTAGGAGCVFFLQKDLKLGVQRALTGFAAGVMVAASIWSLIVPAIEQNRAMGRWAFLPGFTYSWCCDCSVVFRPCVNRSGVVVACSVDRNSLG